MSFQDPGILDRPKATWMQSQATGFPTDTLGENLYKTAVVSTTPISILAGLPVIDGYAVSNGQYVLLTAQTNPDENGIYQVSQNPWVLIETAAGVTLVQNGTVHGGTFWGFINGFWVSVGGSGSSGTTTTINGLSGDVDLVSVAQPGGGWSTDPPVPGGNISIDTTGTTVNFAAIHTTPYRVEDFQVFSIGDLTQLFTELHNDNVGFAIELARGSVFGDTPVFVPPYTTISGCGPYFFGSCIQINSGVASDGVTLWELGFQPLNAFYCLLEDFMIDVNGQHAPAGSWNQGLVIITNPQNTVGSGDPSFDPQHRVRNLYIKNASGEGVYQFGRSETVLEKVHVSNCGGTGILATFDSEYDTCKLEGCGLSGMYISHSDVKLVGMNIYNNGTMFPWDGVSKAWVPGNVTWYQGFIYYCILATTGLTAPPSDPTHWSLLTSASRPGGAAPDWGVGLYIDGTSRVEGAALGFDQNATHGVYLRNSSICNLQGRVSNINFYQEYGGSGPSSVVTYAAGLVLDGSSNNILNFTMSGLDLGYALSLINGSSHNEIHITTDGTEIAIFAPGSSIGNNLVIVNGQVLSEPDKVNVVTTAATPYVVPDPFPQHLITLLHTVGATSITLPTAGAGKSVVIGLQQDSTGGVTWTLTGAIKWVGTSVPVPTTAANALDLIALDCLDGVHWLATAALNYG